MQAESDDSSTSPALLSTFQSQANADPAALRAALTQAFGDKASPEQIEQLAQQILSGNTPLPANLQIVPAESLGATNYGAYDAENGGTIYLDARLLDKPALLQDVFNEELGHHLDSVLGGNDARGDEGAVFSQSLRSGLLDQKTRQQLQVEQDHGHIDVDGEQVAVEFRSAEEGSGNGQSPSPSPSPSPSLSPSPSSSSSTGGYDEVGINVPAPAPTPASRGAPHGYNEVGIDVPAPPADPDQNPNGSPSGGPAGDATTGSSWISNVGHFILDVVGLVPVVGECADALNATWYAAEGRFFEASLSAAGTVPFVGIGATIGKWFGVTRTLARTEDLATAAELGAQTLASID